MSVRKKIFDMIEPAEAGKHISSTIYDYFMMVVIIAGLVPLCFKEMNGVLVGLDIFCLCVYALDYVLRLITADFKYKKKGVCSFLRYPFSFLAIMDVLSMLPSITIISDSFKILRVIRMLRTFRVFRAFKLIRYSKSIRVISRVFKRSKASLAAVGTLAVAYIILSALVIFTVEPDSFNNFFEAVYWSTISLTTVGYGDFYPTTHLGQFVTMLSSIFGVAVVALPAGIITAGYMSELEKNSRCTKNDSDESFDSDATKGE